MGEKSCAYCGKPISEEQEECYGKTPSDECGGNWALPCCEHEDCCCNILDGIKPHKDGE